MMSPAGNWFDVPFVSMMTLLPLLDVSKCPDTSAARGKFSATFSASTRATSTRGRPRTTDIRNLLDGLFYLVRTGCQWRHLPPPPAFPPWRTVYGYMRAFADAGVWESIRHHLVVMLREREGKEPSPSAAIVDTQSVKTTARVHLEKGDAGFGISKIELVTVAKVPGIDEATFKEKAEAAKTGCPVSKALAAVAITLDAKLEK